GGPVTSLRPWRPPAPGGRLLADEGLAAQGRARRPQGVRPHLVRCRPRPPRAAPRRASHLIVHRRQGGRRLRTARQRDQSPAGDGRGPRRRADRRLSGVRPSGQAVQVPRRRPAGARSVRDHAAEEIGAGGRAGPGAGPIDRHRWSRHPARPRQGPLRPRPREVEEEPRPSGRRRLASAASCGHHPWPGLGRASARLRQPRRDRGVRL
ncbi:MAG: 5-formyltetrahydrofolate cyclo-ligase, partial [uncultured Sphingomonas sp.]